MYVNDRPTCDSEITTNRRHDPVAAGEIANTDRVPILQLNNFHTLFIFSLTHFAASVGHRKRWRAACIHLRLDPMSRGCDQNEKLLGNIINFIGTSLF